jgi:hypothetical protein
MNSRELSAVPIARYFMVVGSALVVLLIAGWSLPEPPSSFSDRPEIIDRATNRIIEAPGQSNFEAIAQLQSDTQPIAMDRPT